MRILACSIDFYPKEGGVSTFAYEVCRALQQLGHEVVVAAPRIKGFEGFDDKCTLTIARTDFALAPMQPTLAGVRKEVGRVRNSARLLRELIAEHRPDAILVFHWRVFGPAALIAARRRIPYFVMGHGLELAPIVYRGPDGGGIAARFKRFLARRAAMSHAKWRWRTYRRASGAFANSRYTAAILAGVGARPRDTHLSFCGVDPETFRPLDASAIRERHGLTGRRVILTVGRLVPRKGFDTMIRSLPKILESMPDAVYLIAGRGPQEKELRALAEAEGVSGRVVFAGYVPDEELPLYHNAADVFAMVCREREGGDAEGFGIVFLEAGACGKPVVVGDSGGAPDAVEDGETGLLVDPENIDAVANAVVRLLNDSGLASQMGRHGRERVTRSFTWRAVAQRFEKPLLAAVKAKSLPSPPAVDR